MHTHMSVGSCEEEKEAEPVGGEPSGKGSLKGGTWAETRREWGSEPCDASEEEWGQRPQGRNKLAMFEMVKKANTAEEKEKRGRGLEEVNPGFIGAWSLCSLGGPFLQHRK